MICKAVKEVDPTALIIKYKLDKEEEEIIEINKSEITIIAKNSLLNYTKAIPKYSW